MEYLYLQMKLALVMVNIKLYSMCLFSPEPFSETVYSAKLCKLATVLQSTNLIPRVSPFCPLEQEREMERRKSLGSRLAVNYG